MTLFLTLEIFATCAVLAVACAAVLVAGFVLVFYSAVELARMGVWRHES